MKINFNLVEKPIFQKICFFVLIILAIAVRFYKFQSPVADWHSWRQADTASVALEFQKHDYSITKPHYHDLSNIPSGKDNLEGCRMVEFPIINYFVAKTSSFFNSNLISTYRLINIFLSLLGIFALFYFVKIITKNFYLSFWSALFFSFIPYNIFYSRVILPESAMLAFLLLSLMFLAQFLNLKQKKKTKFFYLFLSFLCLSLSFLIKPPAVFILPVYGFLILQKQRQNFKTLFFWALFFLLTILPLYLWRQYIKNFPEGIPASEWLLNGNGIRLKTAWWRWIFIERVGKLLLGFWPLILILMGLVKLNLKKIFKNQYLQVLLVWLFSAFLYLVIFATGNVQHDYYQVLITPILSLILGFFTYHFFSFKAHFNFKIINVVTALILNFVFFLILNKLNFFNETQLNFKQIFVLLILIGFFIFISLLKNKIIQNILKMTILFGLVFNFAFLWQRVRGYYSINNQAIVIAGQVADEILPKDALVIAPYQGDTAFLLQTKRVGWPIGFEIEDKIKKGAQYYITVNYDQEAQDIEKKYQTLIKNKNFLIFELVPKNASQSGELSNY